MLHAVLEGIAGAPRAAADALVRRPAAWLWQCCVRQNHAVAGPPMWLRPRGARSGMLGAWDTTRAAELFFPLLTMSIYGATHYLRWANLARAVGVRMNMRSKALVFGSYMLLPNLLVPVLDLRCLHIVLCIVVAANNLFLYREFCIMEQMATYGQRLPGEPMLVGAFQAANVLHDAFEEPGVILWRKVRRHVPSLLTPGRLTKLRIA